MFWKMDDTDGLPEVTLCEEHALSATNYAMWMVGEEGFGSMAEACVVLTASTALSGFDMGMTSNTVGPCDQCEEEKVNDCS